MTFSKEMLEKIKHSKSADDLFQMVSENNIKISKEEAEIYFNKLNNSSLSDDELDNVTGGCGEPSEPKYSKGYVINTSHFNGKYTDYYTYTVGDLNTYPNDTQYYYYVERYQTSDSPYNVPCTITGVFSESDLDKKVNGTSY